MNKYEIKYFYHLLLSISHIESRFSSWFWKRNYFTLSGSLYEGFSSFGWKPMKSKLLLKCTVRGSHGSVVNRWNLFCPLIHSVVTCRPVNVHTYSLIHYIPPCNLFGMNQERELSILCLPMKNVTTLFVSY